MILDISSIIKYQLIQKLLLHLKYSLGASYVSISPGGSDTFLQENEKFSFTQSFEFK